MKRMTSAASVILVAVLAAAAFAETLYNNDFGTQAQFDALSWSSISGLELVADQPDPPGDLDGDGLFGMVRCTGSSVNWRNGAKGIFAPPFKVLSNPTVSGYGAGFISSHSSGARWALSLDGGANLAHLVTSDNSNTWKQYSTPTEAHDDPAYTRVPVFYAMTGVRHYSGGAYTTSNTGRMGALQVEAEVANPQPGDTVNLTVNDFGAQAQRDEWTITGSAAGNVVYTDAPAYDRDMDDLAAVVGTNATGAAHLVLRIDAAPGLRFSNPAASATGYGSHTYWGSYASLAFSLDGETWEYASTQPTGGHYGYFDMETADTSADSRYASLTTVYLRIALTAYNVGYYPNVRGLTVTGEIVEPELPDNAIYVNDFGTAAQRTVGAGGEWDSQEVLSGAAALTYYPDGYDNISTDWDGDGLHGGLAAEGQGRLRYIKQFTAPAGSVFTNVSASANGHGDPSASASFAVGLSPDGVNWTRVDTVSGAPLPYPDWTATVSTSGDPNFHETNVFYVMVEWNNGTAVTDPALAAYITDVIVQADYLSPPQLDASHLGFYRGGQYDFDFNVGHTNLSTESHMTVEDRQAFWDSVKAAREARRPVLPVFYFADGMTVQDMKDALGRLFDNEGVTTRYSDLLGVCFDEEETPWLQANTRISDPMHNELYAYMKANWPIVDVYRWYTYNVLPLSFAGGVAEMCDGYIFDDYYTKNSLAWRRRTMAHIVTGRKYIPMLWACEPGWPDGTSGYFSEDLDPEKDWADQDLLVVNAPNSSFEQYWWMATDAIREFGLPVSIFGVVDAAGSTYSWFYSERSPNHGYIKNNLVFPTRLDMRTSDGSAAASVDYSVGDGLAVNTGGSFSYTDDYRRKGTGHGLGTLYDASINGFTRLRQTTDMSGVLVTRSDSAGQVELIYRFYAPAGGLSSVSTSLTGSVDPDQGGVNTLALSYNGAQDYTHTASSTPGVSAAETLTLTPGAAYANREAFYVHVIMAHDSSAAGDPANSISELTVTCTHDAGATPIPDPGKCGDFGYAAADIAGGVGLAPGDCVVDLLDFAALAEAWLECTDPADPECQ